VITKIPEVDIVSNSVGLSSSQSTGDNYATLTVMLIPKNERSRGTEQIMQLIKTGIGRIPGAKIYITMPSTGGGGGSAAIQYTVNGPSWQVVSETAARVKKIFAKIPGTADVRLSSADGNPEMKIKIDRKKMSSFGLSMADVGTTLQVGLSGNTDSKYQDEAGNEYDIDVKLDQFDRTRTADIGDLTIANHSGKLVALKQFADISPSTGPTKLERRDRNYAVSILSDAVGRTSGTIGGDINKALAKEQLPPGVTVAPVGGLKQMADSFASLGLAFMAAIIFVYLIMAALYNSFIYPFSVLFSIPLAIIGALLALALTRNSLAIFSIMGIIMLIGLVSKNAILLVDFTNKSRADGYSVKEALMEAGRERLRPILMTTMTMILGMLPLAIATSAGSEWKKSLGWALIGGLSSSMLMTLVVVPVVYTKIEHLRASFVSLGQRVNRKSPRNL
jgi:hydrophobic/amphiphilic exporter-1 (mainly G- bacteria), HAE1 family